MQSEVGSEMLLLNVERYGQYFSLALENDDIDISSIISESKTISRDNIGEKTGPWTTIFSTFHYLQSCKLSLSIRATYQAYCSHPT